MRDGEVSRDLLKPWPWYSRYATELVVIATLTAFWIELTVLGVW